MHRHEAVGEHGRTGAGAPRPPAPVTDLAAFQEHYASVLAFTDALREGRCRRTNHFDARLGETVSVFRPIFSTWNTEVLFLLYMKGPLRFNGLKRTLGVSSRVLTDKLRHLEDTGLVGRHGDGPTPGYALTPRGEVVARHLHPLVFFLHNERALPPPPPAGDGPGATG